MEAKFARDSAVRQIEPGVFEGEVNRDWWIVFGPNGGFVATWSDGNVALGKDSHVAGRWFDAAGQPTGPTA